MAVQPWSKACRAAVVMAFKPAAGLGLGRLNPGGTHCHSRGVLQGLQPSWLPTAEGWAASCQLPVCLTASARLAMQAVCSQKSN